MPVNPKANETKDEFISRCIGEEVSAGFDTPQAAAICYSYWDKNKMGKIKDTSAKVMAKVAYDTKYRGINLNLGQILPDGSYEFEEPCWEGYEQYGTKILDGREVPNCIPQSDNMSEEGNINVFGIDTEYFHMCPGAIALFKHLTSMEMDEDTIGMVRSAALIADRIFDIEEDVLEVGKAEASDAGQVFKLVSDFKDLMKEIDEEVGMVHDVSFMDGHIKVIKDLL